MRCGRKQRIKKKRKMGRKEEELGGKREETSQWKEILKRKLEMTSREEGMEEGDVRGRV